MLTILNVRLSRPLFLGANMPVKKEKQHTYTRNISNELIVLVLTTMREMKRRRQERIIGKYLDVKEMSFL